MGRARTAGAAPVTISPGDVLLFHGNSFVSWAIRRFDGSDVNHAALAIDAEAMIEAAGSGLVRTPSANAIAGNERTVVRRLATTTDLSPVTAKGEGYLASGVPYAYQQIVLLAFLSISRKLDIGNRLLRRILRVALDKAAQLINSLLEDGTELMICSEFVFRAYVDTADVRFGLDILPPDQRPQALAAAAQGVRLEDWARLRPEPSALGVPAGIGGGDPDAIAKEAEIELEPLIERYARTVAPTDPVVLAQPPSPEALALEEDTSDEELHAASVAFRDALLSAAGARVGVDAAALASDRWDLFDTVADFVTPGDLLYCPTLATVGTLRKGG